MVETEIFVCPDGRHYILSRDAIKDEITGNFVCPIDGYDLKPTTMHGSKWIKFLKDSHRLPPIGSGVIEHEQ